MDYKKLSQPSILIQVNTDKTNYLYWLILGWETEDQSQALAYFRKALALRPGDPVVLDSISAVQEKYLDVARANVESNLITRDEAKPAAFGKKPREFPFAKHPGTPYILYLLGLTLAEYLTAMSSPQVGLVLHGLILLTLFIQAAFSARSYKYRLYLVLTLAPLVRLMSLSMPLVQFEFVNWYMIIGLPLLLAGILTMRLAGYPPKQVGLGLGKKWWLQVLAVLTGFGWGYLEYLILKPAPLIDTFTWQQIWYPALVLLVFTGFLEEFIFRGMMQRAAVQGLGKWGLVFTAGIFAVLHIGYLSILDVLFVFVVGMFFSLVVQRTNSVWGVTLSHGLTNIALFLIFPFLVP